MEINRLKMLNNFITDEYLNQYLTPRQQQTFKILLWLIQVHKVVTLEKLSAYLPLPVLYESRRKHIQRFLALPSLNIKTFWLPIVQKIIKSIFLQESTIFLTIDRTSWAHINCFLLGVIYQKRVLPVYWIMLNKKGSSNLSEQKQLLEPVLNILNNYNLVILGDREFHSIHLAHWLQLENNRRKNQINFAFRQKKNTQIGQENGSMVALKKLLVVPGIKHFFKSVKVTKTFQKKGFNVGVYQKRKYFQKTEHEPWYILTNLPTAEEAISAYKKRWSIEAMFKDSKSGGYNLQNTKASIKRSECLILLIAIAYISTTLKGVKIKNKQVQQYICRLQDKKRKEKRHSSFWVGFYGESWVKTWDFLKEEIEALMVLNPDKLKYYLKGLRAMSLIQAIQT